MFLDCSIQMIIYFSGRITLNCIANMLCYQNNGKNGNTSPVIHMPRMIAIESSFYYAVAPWTLLKVTSFRNNINLVELSQIRCLTTTKEASFRSMFHLCFGDVDMNGELKGYIFISRMARRAQLRVDDGKVSCTCRKPTQELCGYFDLNRQTKDYVFSVVTPYSIIFLD